MALGVLVLLRNVGLLPGPVPFGPVLLLVVGGVVLYLATRPQPTSAATRLLTLPRGGATAASVRFNHGAGTLRVSSGATETDLITGTVQGEVDVNVEHAQGGMQVTLQPVASWDRWPSEHLGSEWTLALPAGLALDLDVRTGASQVRLDLSDLDVRSLNVQTGASNVEVVVPARANCRVSISAGAADVRVVVPEGTAAQIHNRSALASFTVDQARFPLANGAYRSSDYTTATTHVDIDIEGGLASFSVQ
jgi:hypothetical protein